MLGPGKHPEVASLQVVAHLLCLVVCPVVVAVVAVGIGVEVVGAGVDMVVAVPPLHPLPPPPCWAPRSSPG